MTTTPSYTELVAAVRSEGEMLVAAAGLGLDAAVPTCDGWDVEALVEHASLVYRRIAKTVATRATQSLDADPGRPEGEPVDVLRESLDDLVATLSDCDANAPVWNWSANEPHLAQFWARRAAHESAIHRFDAQTAHDITQPIDVDLARDGLDELFGVIAPRVYSRDSVEGPTGTVSLDSTDNGSWCLSLLPDTVEVMVVGSTPPDVTARANTGVLLLAAYGRLPWTWSSIDVSGDLSLLDRWAAALSF